MALESPCCRAGKQGRRSGDDIPDNQRPTPWDAVTSGPVQYQCKACEAWSYIGNWRDVEDTSDDQEDE